jgi:kynurenine formamidase
VDDRGKLVGYVPPPLNNWGRWGADDRRGAGNFVTPEAIVAAARLVRRGKVFSLALPIDRTAPVPTGRMAPLHLMVASGRDRLAAYGSTDDFLIMSLQGSTQWDGYSHWPEDDVLYNGFWAGTIDGDGAHKLGIEHLSTTLCGRGVLLDICRLKGVDRLELGYAITPADLDAAAARQGVEIRSGDLLFVRTGHVGWWWGLEDKAAFYGKQAGLSLACGEWIHDKEIVAAAADNRALEVVPPEAPGTRGLPLHTVLLRDLGVTIGEFFQLDALAEDCARDGVYEFFVSAPPLLVTGGVGSPLNPLVLK